MKSDILMTLGQTAVDRINAAGSQMFAHLQVPDDTEDPPFQEYAPPRVEIFAFYRPKEIELTTAIHRLVIVVIEWHTDEVVSAVVRRAHFPQIPQGAPPWMRGENPCANIVYQRTYGVVGEKAGPLHSIQLQDGERTGYYRIHEDDPQEYADWIHTRAAKWLLERHAFREG